MANAGLRVTACDISPAMLHRAEASDPGGIVNWVGLNPGWRTLPFESHVFDAVVAASVFEYVVDPPTVLAECARTLRPGGVVLCTVPNLTHPIRWLEWLLSLSAHIPLTAALAHRWPQLQNYLTYLRISRQRHFARWWRAAAVHSGLHAIAETEGTSDHAPLRTFSFQLINDAEGR
jgi:ubiquinone/menaquinone biosynthesis C-methylase UbiE